ncbi:dirigent protein 21-like [Abrus precatorius]|uniref:Dirigent protein n=1 Tax=Abrus precatorius TaxID=3816 RepID=A0A8B8LS48_ABRPR|nr:dirigent protein 21-like [Abrus precatorius]
MNVPLAFFSLSSLTLISTHGAFSQQSHIKLPSEHHTKEKLTHIHFYYHDIRNEKNPTIVQVTESPKNVPNGFGTTFMMDDAMTEGPELSSKQIGRAQGLFGLASLEDLGMFMLTNFAFKDGIYAGSTLSMLGRNPIAEQNREMPIVGGTGAFRFATGYAIANSVNSISTPEHFVVEYNITLRLS